MYAQIYMCQECEKALFSIFCKSCEQFLCDCCSGVLHKGGTRKSHELISYKGKSQETAKNFEKELEIEGDRKETFLKEHIRDTEISINNAIGVYWDMYRTSLKDLKETASFLNFRYGKNTEIKVYAGETSEMQTGDLEKSRIVLRSLRHGSEISGILTEIYKEARFFTKQVLITPRSHAFKAQFELLSRTFGSCRLFFLTSPSDKYEIPADQISVSSDFTISSKAIKETSSSNKNFSELPKRILPECSLSLEKSMISQLKSLAYQGILMHEYKELRETLSKSLKISKFQTADLINSSLKLGKLLQQTKKIGSLDLTIISLKVEKLTSKALLWVLRSLKNDEMISTEKAIQSRLKEAFDLKIPPHVWTSFLEYSVKSSRIRRKKSVSESQGFSFFSQKTECALRNFSFHMKKISDLGSSTENLAIYPMHEEWVPYDHYIKSGDVFKIKQTCEWESFVRFFDQLFHIGNPEERAISGGRYGCAQYLKHFSPSLRNCSLGKLSYMIQLAIDDELLRYHKTLLVWAPVFDRICKEDKAFLYQSKKAIVEALNQCAEGISLAQLPTLLKEKMPFELDLARTGFSKLKDLILSIPDLELISKGKNHPFVRIRKTMGPSAEGLASFLMKIIENAEEKLKVAQAEFEVCENFGYNWRINGKVRNLEEFIRASSDLGVCDKGFVENKHKNFMYHSYSSSTASEAYSYVPSSENQSGDSDLWGKNKEFEDMQMKFIEEMIEED